MSPFAGPPYVDVDVDEDEDEDIFWNHTFAVQFYSMKWSSIISNLPVIHVAQEGLLVQFHLVDPVIKAQHIL